MATDQLLRVEQLQHLEEKKCVSGPGGGGKQRLAGRFSGYLWETNQARALPVEGSAFPVIAQVAVRG